jgi:hypothetical protein
MDYQQAYEEAKQHWEDALDVLARIARRKEQQRPQPGPLDQHDGRWAVDQAFAFFEENGILPLIDGRTIKTPGEQPAKAKRGPKPKYPEPPHIRSLAMTLTDEADACA